MHTYKFFNLDSPIEAGDFFILPFKQSTAIELCYGIVLSHTTTGLPRVALFRSVYHGGKQRTERLVVRKPENMIYVEDIEVPIGARTELMNEYNEHS